MKNTFRQRSWSATSATSLPDPRPYESFILDRTEPTVARTVQAWVSVSGADRRKANPWAVIDTSALIAIGRVAAGAAPHVARAVLARVGDEEAAILSIV